MINSDKIFFGTIAIAIISSVLVFFYPMIMDIAIFWWAILVPFALTKITFPNSRLAMWLNKKEFF
jgi:hypothetical protein